MGNDECRHGALGQCWQLEGSALGNETWDMQNTAANTDVTWGK